MTRSVSGLYVRELEAGLGIRATTGDLVRIRYTVHLADGTWIAGTTAGEAPFEFRLGRREVIAGWDEGITGMRVGERRQLVVPPSLAYGTRARGNIPANSILVFTLELVGIGD
jgi:FKBP-type peptidyl-prolyl cis-trans isomerase